MIMGCGIIPPMKNSNSPESPGQLGLIGATSMVVASMIGVGAFTTSGFLAADLNSRPLILAAWAVGGLIAMLGALNYVSLSKMVPESGGEYTYLSRLINPVAGFLGGWISLLVGFSAPLAAAALLCGSYLETYIPGIPGMLLATGVLILFSIIQLFGFSLATGVHKAIVWTKLVLILVFVGLAASDLPELPPHQSAPFNPGTFSISLYWIFFSYSGWNAAVYMSREIQNPQKTVGLALILGTAIVTILYLALNFVFIHAVPLEQIKGEEAVALIAARSLGGPFLHHCVAIVISIGLLTSISAMMFLGPRVYGKMAQDGLFPTAMAGTSPPFRNGCLFQTLIALIMVWTSSFDKIVNFAGFLLGISTAMCIGAMAVKRLRSPGGSPAPVIGWPVIPILYISIIAAQVIFTFKNQPATILWGILVISSGAIFHLVFRRLKRFRQLS